MLQLRKYQRVLVAITLAASLSSCGTTKLKGSTEGVDELDEAVTALEGSIDSFYIEPCKKPPTINTADATKVEVVLKLFETLNLYLDCYSRHNGLVKKLN